MRRDARSPPARDDGVPVDTMRWRGLEAAKSISHITDLVFHLLSCFYLYGYQRSSNREAKLFIAEGEALSKCMREKKSIFLAL